LYYAREIDIFFQKAVSISCAYKYKITEKRQTLQGYIICILQHFATKLWITTNFAMLFQAVMKFLSRSKFCSLGNRSIAINILDRDEPIPEKSRFADPIYRSRYKKIIGRLIGYGRYFRVELE
jgi:hypothetical protein